MAKCPLILVSTGRGMGELSVFRRQSELYGDSVDRAGGAAVLASGGSAHILAARMDGLLLAGGGDLHPALYGEARNSDRLSIDAARDAEELALFEAFYACGKPIFGICRGIQAINVFLGGTLHQHIEDHGEGCHPVCCTALLGARIGAAPMVNSYHHQACARIAPGLTVAARASDGTVEALVGGSAPLLGVQWHPERMAPPLCEDVKGADHLPLFIWLIERC